MSIKFCQPGALESCDACAGAVHGKAEQEGDAKSFHCSNKRYPLRRSIGSPIVGKHVYSFCCEGSLQKQSCADTLCALKPWRVCGVARLCLNGFVVLQCLCRRRVAVSSAALQCHAGVAAILQISPRCREFGVCCGTHGGAHAGAHGTVPKVF